MPKILGITEIKRHVETLEIGARKGLRRKSQSPFTQLLRNLEKLERASKRENNDDVIVGYSASYAMAVHENLEARHGTEIGRGPNQQAKFLEQPAREFQDEMARLVVTTVKNGGSLIQGLLVTGMKLQRESQKLVPVDTGNLKGSAFTEKA